VRTYPPDAQQSQRDPKNRYNPNECTCSHVLTSLERLKTGMSILGIPTVIENDTVKPISRQVFLLVF
jgi:hypothetical protein